MNKPLAAEAYAAKNLELLKRYIEQKDKLYGELKTIMLKTTKVSNKKMKILRLQGEIEYIRRLICTPSFGVYPTSSDVPPHWSKIPYLKKFF